MIRAPKENRTIRFDVTKLDEADFLDVDVNEVARTAVSMEVRARRNRWLKAFRDAHGTSIAEALKTFNSVVKRAARNRKRK